jgi:hypothetical protein
MYVATYTFTGEPTDLATRFDALLAEFPPDEVILQLCVVGEGGLTVVDTCPDRETFTSFSSSPEFAGALQRHGLPTPTVVALGDLHSTRIREDVTA